MTTTKSVITASIPTDLTTIYTNSTAKGAVLKSININGIGDPTVTQETVGGDEWSIFGSNINPIVSNHAASGAGFGVPYTVQLGDNRVLLLSLPHFQHYGGNQDFFGGNTMHAQITEYQTNRFVAGPIVDITLPTTPYSDASYSLFSLPESRSGRGRGNFQAIALSPTVVVCAYRIRNTFRLFRLTITGNTVNNTDIANLDLTGATFFNTTAPQDFDLAVVRGDTTKVIVGGYGTSNWCLQAYNIPTTGALSLATALYNTGIAVSGFGFAIAPVTKVAIANITTYLVAGCTVAGSFDAQLFSFNSTTPAFTAVGIKVTYARNTTINGLDIQCLSTNDTPNAVIATVDSGTPSNIYFYRQTTLTQAVSAGSVTSTALQHATAKSIIKGYNWGDERAVFLGANSLLVGYNSAGVATNLITASQDSTFTGATQGLWFPFNSRPLYSYYNAGNAPDVSNVPQLYSRRLVTSATSFGIKDSFNNYFPYGHDYDSRHYSWSDVANCWMVGQGGKIYALNKLGVVLSEFKPYDSNNQFNFLETIRDLTVSASGKIVFVMEYGTGYGTSYQPTTTWASLVNQLYAGVTDVVTAGENLFSTSSASATNLTGFLCGKFYKFLDNTGKEIIYYSFMRTIATPALAVAKWDDVWGTTIQCNISHTAGGWHVGWRNQYRLFMNNKPNSGFSEGRWRVIGPYTANSEANNAYLGCSNTPYTFAQFGSMNTGEKALNASTPVNGRSIAGDTNKNFSIAVIYDTFVAKYRIMYSSASNFTGDTVETDFLLSQNANLKYIKLRLSKSLAAISMNNTSSTAQSAIAYIFDSTAASGPYTPEFTLTGTSGTGQITTDLKDRVNIGLYGDGIAKNYLSVGTGESVTLSMAINNGTSDFYITTGIGQTLSSSGTYRSTDTYLIPAGHSLKMKANLSISLGSLVTVVEEI